jgi:glycosyltransferase involved in cell wall biosynthesis
MGPDPDPFIIGYLARIAPEKGLHALCEAYRRLRRREGLPPSRLWAAGYLGRENKSYFAAIRKELAASGLSGEFHYHGELDRAGKIAFLKSLSVFSVPGPYPDPKGLFLLEAAAAGIPVIQPNHGAFTEIVETTGGGILVEPGNADRLADGILELWRNVSKREELASRGYERVRAHYGAAQMSAKTLQLYSSLLKRQAISPRKGAGASFGY